MELGSILMADFRLQIPNKNVYIESEGSNIAEGNFVDSEKVSESRHLGTPPWNR